jgi:hypothetical protein
LFTPVFAQKGWCKYKLVGGDFKKSWNSMQKLKIELIISIIFLISFANKSMAQKTTVPSKRQTAFHRDSSRSITKKEFDNMVDTCILLLNNNELKAIPDSGHIRIMLCLNTIFMAHTPQFGRRFIGGRYEVLDALCTTKKYTTDIIKVYPKWIPNRGMGFYFPDLNMELYGTPSLYAWLQVKE